MVAVPRFVLELLDDLFDGLDLAERGECLGGICERGTDFDQDKWELYRLDDDFSEANDLAQSMPEKLNELKAKFDAAAEKYHVYPLDDRGAARLGGPKPPPPGSDPKATSFTYYPGATRLAENAAPPMKNRSWTLTAHVVASGAKTQGVVLGFGGVAGFAMEAARILFWVFIILFVVSLVAGLLRRA